MYFKPSLEIHDDRVLLHVLLKFPQILPIDIKLILIGRHKVRLW